MLMGIALVGTVFWVVSPEVSAAYYGSELGWSPLLVGVTVAAAQAPVYTLVYFGGERLAGRWRWLGRQIERARRRLSGRGVRGFLAVSAVAAVTGLPPVIAMCAMGAAWGVPARMLLPVVVAGRVVRFTALAGAAGALLGPWLAGGP